MRAVICRPVRWGSIRPARRALPQSAGRPLCAASCRKRPAARRRFESVTAIMRQHLHLNYPGRRAASFLRRLAASPSSRRIARHRPRLQRRVRSTPHTSRPRSLGGRAPFIRNVDRERQRQWVRAELRDQSHTDVGRLCPSAMKLKLDRTLLRELVKRPRLRASVKRLGMPHLRACIRACRFLVRAWPLRCPRRLDGARLAVLPSRRHRARRNPRRGLYGAGGEAFAVWLPLRSVWDLMGETTRTYEDPASSRRLVRRATAGRRTGALPPISWPK